MSRGFTIVGGNTGIAGGSSFITSVDTTALQVVTGQLQITALNLGLALGSSYDGATLQISGGKLMVNPATGATGTGLDLASAIAATVGTALSVSGGSLNVANVPPSVLISGTLAAGVILSSSIAATQILAGTLAAGVIYAGSIAVGQLTAGSAAFASTTTFGVGTNSVQISSTGIQVTGGGVLIAPLSSGLSLTSGDLTVGYDTSHYVQVSSSGVYILGGGVTITQSSGVGITSGQLTIAYDSNHYVAVSSSGINLVYAGTTVFSVGSSSQATVNGTLLATNIVASTGLLVGLSSGITMTTTNINIASGTFSIGGATVINSSGVHVGSGGVNVTGPIITSSTMQAGSGGFTVGSAGTVGCPGIVIGSGGVLTNLGGSNRAGQTVAVAPSGGFTSGGSPYTNMNFWNGILVLLS